MQTLLAAPRQDLDEATVTAALLYGRKVRHGVDVLDTSDRQTNETIRWEEGEVRWSYRPADRVTGETTEAAAVRRQASLTLDGPQGFSSVVNRRFRLWTEILSPSGVWVRFWLGVFAATVPPTEDDGMVIRQRLTLADKSHRWNERTLTEPLTVTASTNVVDYVESSLTSVFGESRFAIPSSEFTLADDMTFEASTSYLKLYNTLLEAAGYDQLSADEAGLPASQPLSTLLAKTYEVHYGPGERKIVTASTIEPLLTSLPNVVEFHARSGPSLAEEGNGIRTVKNQSTGPASIDQRGEEVVLKVTVDVDDQDELDTVAYADAQRYFAGGGERFTGQVALNPLHGDRDFIRLTKPRIGLAAADFWVTQWTYPLRPVTGPEAVLMAVVAERHVSVSGL